MAHKTTSIPATQNVQVPLDLKDALVAQLQHVPWFRGAGLTEYRGRPVVKLLVASDGLVAASRAIARMGVARDVRLVSTGVIRAQAPGLSGLASSICSGEPAVRAATEQVRADARELMRTSKWVTVAVAAAAGAVGSIAKGPIVGGVLAGGLAWLVFTTQAATYNFD